MLFLENNLRMLLNSRPKQEFVLENLVRRPGENPKTSAKQAALRSAYHSGNMNINQRLLDDLGLRKLDA